MQSMLEAPVVVIRLVMPLGFVKELDMESVVVLKLFRRYFVRFYESFWVIVATVAGLKVRVGIYALATLIRASCDVGGTKGLRFAEPALRI